MLRPHAERALAAAEEAAESVKEVRTLTGGTVSFGTFGSAHHYLLGGLVQDFRRRYPDVRVRVVGQNSAEVADAIRDGQLEAGLIALPIDDRGLEVRPSIREENHYVSASPQRLGKPKTIEEIAAAPLILYDARWGVDDPTRRQLRERAQRAGDVAPLPPGAGERVHHGRMRGRRDREPDAGQRHAAQQRADLVTEAAARHQRQALGPLRELPEELHRDAAAERVADDRGAIDADRREHVADHRRMCA